MKLWIDDLRPAPSGYIWVKSVKAAKTAIKTKDQKAAADAKNWTKVIKSVRSPKTGAYTFKESIVHKDKIKDFLAS